MCARESQQPAWLSFLGYLDGPRYSPDPYDALQELQLKLKLQGATISSAEEELEDEDANGGGKPVTEEETLEVKEEIAVVQVTVVPAFQQGLCDYCSVCATRSVTSQLPHTPLG